MHKLVFAALFLFSCSKPSHWSSDQIHSGVIDCNSTKLSYFSKDPLHGIDLELIQTTESLKVYLNIHSIPIPPFRENPKAASVKIKIHSKVLICQAYRFEGGQRLLLPDEIADMLIETLKNGHEVTLSLPGYSSVIHVEDFTSKFDKLQHPFPLKNPFHLPL